MKRGTKIYLKGHDGIARGPFRWTDISEWVAAGQLTPDDEVRLPDVVAWSRIATLPELLPPPPPDGTTPALSTPRPPAGMSSPLGPRAAAYLQLLGCPIAPSRLNPVTALHWIRILEDLNPHLESATEHWAAEEESQGRVPAASRLDATPAQLETLRAMGLTPTAGLTRQEAHRLISGPPTEGQLRRLNFYGVDLPPGACKDEAADLIDRYMREHWDSEEAYRAHKANLAAESSGQPKPAPVLKLRAPPPLGDPEFALPVSPGNRPPATAVPPPPSNAWPGRRVAALVVTTVVLVVAGLAWWSHQQRNAARPSTPGASAAPGLAATPPVRAIKVTVLEAADPVRSESLRAFVSALELTGVIGGPEPRAMIAGRLYRVGDKVDDPRAVVVLQIDADANSVTFGDGAGNIVQRRLE